MRKKKEVHVGAFSHGEEVTPTPGATFVNKLHIVREVAAHALCTQIIHNISIEPLIAIAFNHLFSWPDF